MQVTVGHLMMLELFVKVINYLIFYRIQQLVGGYLCIEHTIVWEMFVLKIFHGVKFSLSVPRKLSPGSYHRDEYGRALCISG